MRRIVSQVCMAMMLVAGSMTVMAEDAPVISTICIDAETGRVFSEDHADVVRPPASMIKLILLLIAAEGIDAGRWDLEQPITASAHAQHMGGTQVHLEAGETWPLGKMLEAIAVASANDASMAVAEGLWGSEAACLAAMNERARQLDMDATIFRSVHGLPPDAGELPDATTARDMAKLGMACARHPRIMAWCGTKEITFRPGTQAKFSTNKLLWRMPDCDGMKTGFIRAAGFCITATAMRDDIRLIAVVMGHPTPYGRFNLAQEILESAFSEVSRVPVLATDLALVDRLPVHDGEADGVAVVPEENIWLTLRPGDRERLIFEAFEDEELRAPLAAGKRIGELTITLDGQELGRTGLLTAEAIQLAGWRLRLQNGTARWEGLDRDGALN